MDVLRDSTPLVLEKQGVFTSPLKKVIVNMLHRGKIKYLQVPAKNLGEAERQTWKNWFAHIAIRSAIALQRGLSHLARTASSVLPSPKITATSILSLIH